MRVVLRRTVAGDFTNMSLKPEHPFNHRNLEKSVLSDGKVITSLLIDLIGQ